ncbi:MAG TPA: hypothetical protein VHD32_09780 [Candidatus Didemnitutus sp.]|nr:hypothetical protein [Candidatus Didemnitutus sp.]
MKRQSIWTRELGGTPLGAILGIVVCAGMIYEGVKGVLFGDAAAIFSIGNHRYFGASARCLGAAYLTILAAIVLADLGLGSWYNSPRQKFVMRSAAFFAFAAAGSLFAAIILRLS